jgi:hypothetical protein
MVDDLELVRRQIGEMVVATNRDSIVLHPEFVALMNFAGQETARNLPLEEFLERYRAIQTVVPV